LYKTILVPLDGSERAQAILPHVESLALSLKSVVILLYVDETAGLMLGRDEVIDVNDFLEKRHARIKENRAYLQNIVDRWRPVGIEARISTASGSVVAGILDTAEREKADLVAMASHGQGGSKRTFYGSVAVGVLNRIDRPLLLIRSRVVEPPIRA
jgi:nucleotide-binding universal stress UspA family protein